MDEPSTRKLTTGEQQPETSQTKQASGQDNNDQPGAAMESSDDNLYEETVSKKVKTPPIVVPNAAEYNIIIKLLNWNLKDDYKLHFIAQDIEIITSSLGYYSSLLKLLKEDSLEHYTYMLQKEKPFDFTSTAPPNLDYSNIILNLNGLVSSLQILFAESEVEPGLRAHRLKKLKGRWASSPSLISKLIVAYTSTRSNPATDDEITLILNEMDFDYNSEFER
uniref:(California timema) hypothetical protein n=1 Tax=Timema californicum TaxID=61474 RepID=A0A7R9JGW4_TIMCA|nr:unnamed protein product [Timema californicum]